MSGRCLGVLAAMLALLAAALATGTPVYYYLFFILLAMLLFALASALWTLFTVSVSMKGVKGKVSRGDKLMIIITMSHRSPLPAGALRATLNVPSVGGAKQEISFSARPFAKHSYRSVILCAHRGNYEVGIRAMTAEDIFGLFCFTRKSKKKLLRVEVYPKAMPMNCMQLKPSDMGPEFRSRASEDAASPSNIRKWQEGDELKKVHWKLSLRKRELMVRTFEESARPDTLVIPDMSEIAALADQKLSMEDWLCDGALGAVKAQLEEGFPVRMPLQCADPQEIAGKSVADIGAFTEALMRAKFDSPYPYEQVLLLMLARMQRTGAVVLVTTRLSTRVADIVLRMQTTGIQTRFLWIADAPRAESLEMLERLKMAGSIVQRIDPWGEDAPERSADTFDL